ncbi:MAG: hypothetical protein GF311_00520 [Candidatus Lokiarchaeota archaeon]|nr:hypothetical protein [Candidatus Lokiarchaeota archaeon]
MVYFEISRVGFNCGYDKDKCLDYPNKCINCVKSRLREMSFEIHANIRISEMDSEEKREKMYQDLIWQKFLDVLNIKHIILMSKSSGSAIVDYPITGAGVDVGLLSGFIQANISFSQNETFNNAGEEEKISVFEQQFYEFDYKDFTILLKSGDLIRSCLVLEQKASESLKNLVSEFIIDYERRYRTNILRYESSGQLTFNESIDYIINTFNVQLVFPMVLSHTIPPDVSENINENYVKRAIMKFAKELLLEKPFFFINNILNRVTNIANIDVKIVLYEVYQLLELNVIIPTKLEVAESKFKSFQESRAIHFEKNKNLNSLLSNDKEFDTLKQKAKNIDTGEAEILMNKFIKKGEVSENAMIYQAALKEYEKALYLASGFDFEDAIGKISFKILEVQKKTTDMELEYAQEAGEKAEKRKDYINSIRYYKKAIDILEESLQTVQVNPDETEEKIRKLEKKISKLEAKI